MRGPCRKAPPVASWRPSRSSSLLPNTARSGMPDSRYPARTDGAQTSPRWRMTPTPSARNRSRAVAAAAAWSWDSERIPAFMVPSVADRREEGLPDLLLPDRVGYLPPVALDEVEGVRHLVRLRGDLGESDVRPQRVQGAGLVVEDPDAVVDEDVHHGVPGGCGVVEDHPGGPVPGHLVPKEFPHLRVGDERGHFHLP